VTVALSRGVVDLAGAHRSKLVKDRVDAVRRHRGGGKGSHGYFGSWTSGSRVELVPLINDRGNGWRHGTMVVEEMGMRGETERTRACATLGDYICTGDGADGVEWAVQSVGKRGGGPRERGL
jgi:hypothetical protein